jgi:hypothetical protein
MVRKIQSGEYLKRYDNMTAVERREYLSRVGDWLSVDGQSLTKKGEVFEARLQNVLQISAAWNDTECQAFEDGVVLLSALTGMTETKLPDILYAISAKRSIKHVFQSLWAVDAEAGMADTITNNHDCNATLSRREPITDGNTENGAKEEPAEGKAAIKREQDGTGSDPAEREQARPEVNPTQAVAPLLGNASDGVVPARPKHIDQYVHLLPKKTQEHAALVQGLYREMEEAREKLNLLMNDQTASAADREAWAKKVTKCDNTLRKILDELDAEWAKLVKEGRVVVDDLGNARVVPIDNGQLTIDNEAGATQEQEPAGLTSEQKARRRELRKWLIDTRRGNGPTRDERVKQWYENFREYLTLEGDAAFKDEKIKEAIEHYGIRIEELKN